MSHFLLFPHERMLSIHCLCNQPLDDPVKHIAIRKFTLNVRPNKKTKNKLSLTNPLGIFWFIAIFITNRDSGNEQII